MIATGILIAVLSTFGFSRADDGPRLLKPGGSALINVFRRFPGLKERERGAASRGKFARVRPSKPHARAPQSPEMYLLAKDLVMV